MHHAARSDGHVAVVDALHLRVEVRALLPVLRVPAALLFLLLPLLICIEEALHLLWRRRIGVVDLDLDEDLLRRQRSFQEASGVGLVVVAVLVVRADRQVVPAYSSGSPGRITCFVNGLVKVAKRNGVAQLTRNHLHLVVHLHHRSHSLYA